MNYWLVKSEPHVFSIDDLKRSTRKTTAWQGVRNYQSRNTLRDLMKKKDKVLFYHSSCETPAIVGLARVVREGYPDTSAFDPKSPYFDPKSKLDKPTWMMVDITLEKKFKRILALSKLREYPELSEMILLKKGSRLSVQPVRESEFQFILSLAGAN